MRISAYTPKSNVEHLLRLVSRNVNATLYIRSIMVIRGQEHFGEYDAKYPGTTDFAHTVSYDR